MEENKPLDENKQLEYKFICDKCNFKTRYESHWKIHIETELHRNRIT
jgi:hypothetical protein